MPDTTTRAAKLPRGTVTTRVKTARLQPGDLVLTTPAGDPPQDRTVQPQQSKTGAIVREVRELTAIMGLSIGRNRQQRTYTVHFSDGTRAEGLAPIYTWNGVPGTLADLIAGA